MNRLLHLDFALAVGEHVRADIIEFEGGLSRIATEKWFTTLRFNRLYPTSDAFDRALRTTGVPDLGEIAAAVGLQQVWELSNQSEAQDFRDWFWTTVAPLAVSGGRATGEILRVATRMLESLDAPTFRIARELKMRVFQATGSDYIVGSRGTHGRGGFAARAERGDKSLLSQIANQGKLRRAAIRELVGAEPAAYSACPCGSTERYRFCCGRPDLTTL